MKVFIAILLFFALSGIRVPASFAQQDQSYQKLAQEMETLKEEVSTLQSQLQTVENIEKMKLSAELADAKAKLTDANAKLMNAEFEKFERGLRDSNDDWLIKWILIFLAFISAVGITILTVVWNNFKSTVNLLVANEIEKRVNRFVEAVDEVGVLKNQIKEAIGQVNILENKVKVLDKEHAAEMLGRFIGYPLSGEDAPVQIKELKEEALLEVFRDETRHPDIKNRAAGVLAGRQSPRLVSPVLEHLNLTLDSHQDKELSLSIASPQRYLVNLLGYSEVHTLI